MTVGVPSDYLLARDFCSYGYFLLAPNHWEPATATLTTTFEVAGGAVSVRVRQGARGDAAGRALTVVADRALDAAAKKQVRATLTRMLRLDEDAEQIAGFHAVDPRFVGCGRGRLMRSATLFEDVIKTVTSCNVTWPSTVAMNTKLCRVFGKKSPSGLHAFPSAAKLARARPAALRARCSVGYRDARIVELARLAAKGDWIDEAMGDDELVEALIELPGIGPYAAANIMQLMGRYAHLPLDTESIRHGRSVLGFKGTARQVMKRVQAHFEPMGEHKFRSYWFEMWRYYESKRGPSWTWERETTGKTFTAALLD